MFGFKRKIPKEQSKQFRIVVNHPQQNDEQLSIDVLDEANNELLLSQNVSQQKQSSLSEVSLKQKKTTVPLGINSETERLSKELNEIKKIFEEYGFDKLKEQQKILQNQNIDLQNQILAKQSLIEELEKTIQIMKDEAVNAFKQNIDAYGLKFITDFINNPHAKHKG